MESDGAVALFNRSVEKLGLMCKQYIGDGDSKSYPMVCASYPYGPTEFIENDEYISHVTKQMGIQLREIVRRQKGSFNLRHYYCILYVGILPEIVLQNQVLRSYSSNKFSTPIFQYFDILLIL